MQDVMGRWLRHDYATMAVGPLDAVREAWQAKWREVYAQRYAPGTTRASVFAQDAGASDGVGPAPRGMGPVAAAIAAATARGGGGRGGAFPGHGTRAAGPQAVGKAAGAAPTAGQWDFSWPKDLDLPGAGAWPFFGMVCREQQRHAPVMRYATAGATAAALAAAAAVVVAADQRAVMALAGLRLPVTLALAGSI